jgi:hypothetical protein
MSCRKALQELSRQGIIEFGRPARQGLFIAKSPPRTPDFAPQIQEITGSLEELGAIEITPVDARAISASRPRIESCLAIDIVVAWRIYHLTRLGRETPDTPCAVFFEDHEWKALVAYWTHDPAPKEPPTLRQAIRMTAQLGGFLGRTGDGEPGAKTMWLGLQRLDDLAAMYRFMNQFVVPRPQNSTVSSNPGYG